MTYTSEILLALIARAESLFQRLSNEDLSNLSKGRRLKHQRKLESLWLYKEALSYIEELELYTEDSTKVIYKALLDIVSGKDTTVTLNPNGEISAPGLDYYSPVVGLLSVGLSTNSESIFTILNSPLTSSGTLELNLDSQNANLILASPNGTSGLPVFRALVASDIPTLTGYIQNQSAGAQTANGWISGNFKIEEDLYAYGTSYLDNILIPDGNSIIFGTSAVLISGSAIGGEIIFTTNNTLRLTIGSSGSIFSGSLTANSFIKSGGTSGQFLKADGSVDSSTYLTANQSISLTSEASGSGTTSIAVTLSNSAVIGKVLTGYTSGAGTVAATDTILSAIQKLDGNIQALGSGGSGTIDGSGTTNYIPKFSASTTLANSVMAEVGSNILIGTLTDDTVHKLQVYGNAKIGANGTSGILSFPNTVSSFTSKIETEYGSNAFTITGATNRLRFTQNDIVLGDSSSAYLTINKGSHLLSLSVYFTDRIKIEGSGFPNKTQFLDTRVLINTTTDDGSNILQVNGNTKLTGNLAFSSTSGILSWGGTENGITYSGDDLQFSTWAGVYRFKQNATLSTMMWVDQFGNTRTSGYFGPLDTLTSTTVSGSNGEGGSAGTSLILQGGTSGTAPNYAGGNGGDLIIKNGLATDNSLGLGGTAGNIIFQYGNYNTDGWFEFGRINKVGRFLIGSPTDNGTDKVQITGSTAISTALTLGTTLTLTTNPTLTSTVLNDILVRDSAGIVKRLSSNDISFIKLRKASIDALTTGTYTISNLQDNFVPIGYTVVVNTATAVSGAATVSIGTNASTYNNVDTLPALGLSSATTTGQVYTKFFDDVNKNKLNSADDLRVNVSVAATGTTYNIDIILFGYIIT